MAQTAYETLKLAVEKYQSMLSEAKTKLNDLQTFPAWLDLYAIWNDPRVQGAPGSWIINGIWINNMVTSPLRMQKNQEVADYQKKIADQQRAVDSLQANLVKAEDDLVRYENESPITQGQRDAKEKSKTWMIVGLVVVGLLLLGGAVWYFSKGNKKATPAQS